MSYELQTHVKKPFGTYRTFLLPKQNVESSSLLTRFPQNR